MKITEILDRPIAYHRVFVTLTGSVKAAVFLSQAVYWQPRSKQADGWWYKTAEEWEEETGLTRREQEKARKDCEKYLKSELRGIPATLYWRLDEEAIREVLFPSKGETSFDKKVNLDSTKSENINRNTETTTENKEKPDLMDGMLHYAKEAQKVLPVEAVLVELEQGLKINLDRSLKNQTTAKWILKQAENGQTLSQWLKWCKSDEWRLAHLYLYADLGRIRTEWPQAFNQPESIRVREKTEYELWLEEHGN